MLAWAVLIILAAVNGRTNALRKAVISLDPPWGTLFKGSSFTLTCIGPEGDDHVFYWYKNQVFYSTGVKLAITYATEFNSGEYTCASSKSPESDGVPIIISNYWVILQAPYSAVFEGDTLRLNCIGYPGYRVATTWYYKDFQLILQTSEQQSLIFENVKKSDTGTYQCKAKIDTLFSTLYESSKVWIEVQELFSSPLLRRSNAWSVFIEGQKVTFECYTELNYRKLNTQLRFYFYKDGSKIVESSSPEFIIPTIHLRDAGSYKCGVHALSQNVQKESVSLRISVQRVKVSGISLVVQPANGQVIEGETLTMTCSVAEGTGTITFTWYKLQPNTCITQQKVNMRHAEHTMTARTDKDSGVYYCTASNDESATRVDSSVAVITVKFVSTDKFASM
ncbi:hypothetical protein NDU88_001633 [Pleurodeles waltl]|uniref:Ig-like domain-containing protein n=1 Tax=Pleurodeles waltl TaxID=8319 RepID=A0AAV7KQ16_PLEWA|nr:hypothetical protein NDU88_001633 [Pleurodeles waltl]